MSFDFENLPSGRSEVPLDGFVHPENWQDEHLLRRARLQIRFGVLAGLASILCSGFFFAIGHIWGGGIIGSCGLITASIPWLVQRSRKLQSTGYLYGCVLLLGFTALCAVSGGITGPAAAWLASVPLVVLLLVDLRGAILWSAVAFSVVLALAICELAGYRFASTYPVEWRSEVAALSMVGLVAFLATLGLVYEQTRQRNMACLNDANQNLASANTQLQALNDERAEFMNIAAHGLRNPLGIVTGYADLMRLQRDLSPEEVRTQAGEILTSATRMTDIISNLLDVQAIEENRMELTSQGFDMEALVSKVVGENITLATQKNIEIEYSAEPGTSQTFADAEATHQILENLVSNAIKYTPTEGHIQIFVGRETADETVLVEVSDTGPGLSEEDQLKLFEKFSKLTPRPTGGEASSGLGLWITRRLALAMGGHVACSSELGRGSKFSLFLPAFSSAQVYRDSRDPTLNNQEFTRDGRVLKDTPADVALAN